MINGVNNLQTNLIGNENVLSKQGAAKAGSSSFADTMNQFLDEVNQLQRDASDATQQLVTGERDDIGGVVNAVEKSDLAFKTLMAIRTKLLDAYEELKNMPI
jgi:flagellar hook-basal body complex protein FliE